MQLGKTIDASWLRSPGYTFLYASIQKNPFSVLKEMFLMMSTAFTLSGFNITISMLHFNFCKIRCLRSCVVTSGVLNGGGGGEQAMA